MIFIFHANCNDGFCAAWLHHRSIPIHTNTTNYISAQYGDDPPDVTGEDVLIFDFSYPRNVLLDMKEKANSLLVFDHHKTAERDLRGLDFCTFDMYTSGARMALQYLYPVDHENWLANYVEDRDLWLWNLPHSKEVSAGLALYERYFNVWNDVYNRGVESLIAEGDTVLRYQRILQDGAIQEDKVGWVSFGGYLVPCINTTVLISEIAGGLAEKYPESPFGAIFFVLNTGEVVYSLRSRGEFDVSEVAKEYGGGGHKNAAGFKTDHVFPMTRR